MEAIGAFFAIVFSLIWVGFMISLSISVVTFGFAMGPISGIIILFIVLSLWFG